MGKEKKYPKATYNSPEDEIPKKRIVEFAADRLSDIGLMLYNTYRWRN